MQQILVDTIDNIERSACLFIRDEKEAYVDFPSVLKDVDIVFRTFIELFVANDDEASKEWVKNVNELLQEFGTQIEKRDTIGIVDTMEYRIKPILQELYQLM